MLLSSCEEDLEFQLGNKVLSNFPFNRKWKLENDLRGKRTFSHHGIMQHVRIVFMQNYVHFQCVLLGKFSITDSVFVWPNAGNHSPGVCIFIKHVMGNEITIFQIYFLCFKL